MANVIKVLDEQVINRIAAGEVVERPVSVVKELVENSIDAQARTIRIDIENGGKKLIRVRDNGNGMSKDDAFLALERHATSKIENEKDLVGVATMGFRGEALASIAAISRMNLSTCDGGPEGGSEILIEGGVLRKFDPLGMAKGTVIQVRDLFFNVPVRRRFLKRNDVEAGHVSDLVTRFALGFPSIGFTYTENNRVKMDAPPVKSTFERIHTLYSKEIRESLIHVDHSDGPLNIQGYVAKPPFSRSDNRNVLNFVNGRSVRDRLLNSAVFKAFAHLMERGRYPLAILFLQLPPEMVDVNVHPQKAEVRFTAPQQVYRLIVDGVYEALTGAPFNRPRGDRDTIFNPSPTSSIPRHVQGERNPEPSAPRAPRRDHVPRADSRMTRQESSPSSPLPPPAEPAPWELPLRDTATPDPAPAATMPDLTPDSTSSELGDRFSSLGILGKLPGSFLVLYSDEHLIVMDHHAAHERILFEDLKQSEANEDRSISQGLLIPKVLEYQPLEARILSTHMGLLRRVGFEVEEFGENAYVVKGVPQWLGNTDLDELFRGLIKVMLDTGLQGDPELLKDEILKDMACKAAAKESKTMEVQEIKALLIDLDRVGGIEVCPHGRPITVRYPLSEIRKKLHRS